MRLAGFLGAVLVGALAAWPAPEELPGGHWRTVGNHRYELRVPADGTADAYTVTIPWQRADPEPARRGTVLLDSTTGAPAARCRRLSITDEVGRFAFAGSPNASYHLYYMPFNTCVRQGGACQSGENDGVEAMTQYEAFNGSCSDEPWWGSEPLEIVVGAYEARTDFNAFTAMERAAGQAQEDALFAKVGKLLLATEDRNNSIRMRKNIPVSWTERTAEDLTSFNGVAQPGEAYTFQVGVAAREVVEVFQAKLVAPLQGPGAAMLATEQLRCMNLEGVDYWGRTFVQNQSMAEPEIHYKGIWKNYTTIWGDEQCANVGNTGATTLEACQHTCLDTEGCNAISFQVVSPHYCTMRACPPGQEVPPVSYPGYNGYYMIDRVPLPPPPPGLQVLPLWFVLRIPEDAVEGSYKGAISVGTSIGMATIDLEVEVRGPAVPRSGYDDPWRGARVAWLDSTLGNEQDVPPPFHALSSWKNGTVQMLDKVVTISDAGFPASVAVGGHEVLAMPARFDVLVEGEAATIESQIEFHSEGDLVHSWLAQGSSKGLDVSVVGSIDATGYFDFNVTLASSSDFEARFVVPLAKEHAIYAAGLGRLGGLLSRWIEGSEPASWSWDGINKNNAVWVGSTRAGLRLYPKGEDAAWQAMVPYDSHRAPAAPESWRNGGAGGIRVWPNGTMEVFTGKRGAGKETFLFSLMATPTRPLDLPKHFRERYAQIDQPTNYSLLRDGGATVVSIHQGNVINPWINYPYLTNDLMKQAADECHALGMKFKVYDTVRELSNHARELWAMRALNETFVWRSAEGGGGDWLREHLQDGYSVAWNSPIDGLEEVDMAIRTNAMSRWNNYYIEGLNQMVQDTGCDGIYLDEIAYDRITMLRAKTVFGAEKLIDHHAHRGAFVSAPIAGYAEAMPFIDSLWYGEGFDYDGATPDHWLVEQSGIPFGLNADLLRYSGMTPFHFRGMLFGNANRWQSIEPSSSIERSPFDPRAVWALWDSFGISNATMHGFWLEEEGSGQVPVATGSADVKCTVFAKAESALVVLANFGKAQSVQLSVSWESLGFGPSGYHWRAPALEPMQPDAQTWPLDAPIDVPASVKGSAISREGWLLMLEKDAAPLVDVPIIV